MADTAHVHLKAEPPPDEIEKFELRSSAVAPFPRAKFIAFLKQLKVQSKDYGLVPFKLLGSQKYLLDEICEALSNGITVIYVLKNRQAGISTFLLALDLFWAFEHKGLLGVFITHEEGSRDDFRSAIEVFFAETPKTHKVNYVRHNRNLLILKNASKFRYLIAGTSSGRKGGLGRSGSANFVHATEVAFYGNDDDLAEFRSQTSSLYPHRLQIYESTANGFNHYEEAWDLAKRDPTKAAIFIGWWRDERNVFPLDHPFFTKYMPDGVASGLTPLERKRVREVRETFGFEISLQQVAWYRWHLESEKIGDQSLMDQEYPWCVVANTRVGTDFGLLRIDHAAKIFNDVGLPLCGTFGKIVKIGPTGTAPIFRATTAMGYVVEGTANHPLIPSASDPNAVMGPKNLEDSLGMTVELVAPLLANSVFSHRWQDGPVVSEVAITADMARLVGLFMGDGSMQVNVLSIACDAKDHDVVLECLRLIEKIFGLTAQTRTTRGCTEVRITSKLIYETFKKMGLLRTDTGPTQRRVHVPEFIWCSPKPVIREFLRGLFEADGFNGYDTPRVVLFSQYKDFLKDIQLLLLGFGITCRRTEPFKISKSRKGKIHNYVGNELQLRKAESIAFNERVGFLSARKQLRFSQTKRRELSDHSSFSLKLEDKIIKVEPIGEAEVFNLTCEGRHLFDANGIVTHNTDQDAFQATGSQFFTSEALTNCIRDAKRHPFLTYRYKLTQKFDETKLQQTRDPRSPLRVWEEASKFGYYVLGCDPAYGSSDEADRTCISVWRCYSDCMVQVAEFCSPEPSTYQCAWVLAHLAGYYGMTYVMPILEITGPGQAVLDELNKVRNLTQEMRPEADEHGIRNILTNMRSFYYKRIDSLSGGLVKEWHTTHELKQRAFHQYKNAIELGRMIPRSLPLIEEMRRIVNDEGNIGGEGRAKDDRVMAAALAYQAFNMWTVGQLKSMGMTLARANEIDARGGTEPVDRLIVNFLKKQNIKVPA